MPQRLERHPADDRRGRAVEKLGDIGTDEGGPEEGVGRALDDQLGAAGVVVAQERGAGDRGEVLLDRLHIEPLLARA